MTTLRAEKATYLLLQAVSVIFGFVCFSIFFATIFGLSTINSDFLVDGIGVVGVLLLSFVIYCSKKLEDLKK
jgi:hypothetical protein